MKRFWPGYVLAYAAWVVLIALGIWLMVLGREAFLTLASFYIKGSLVRSWQVGFGDKVCWLVAGLAWLIFMVATESYFRGGVPQHDLRRRLASVAWPELGLIFVADLILFILQGAAGGWLRWLLLAVELLVTVGLFLAARSLSAARALEEARSMYGPSRAE